MLTVWLPAGNAWAQAATTRDRPTAPVAEAGAPATVRIEIPNLVLGAPASEATFAVRLIPPEPLPANSYVRIRGLPQQVSLSDGHAIAPGAWAVPLAALKDLRIVIPAGLAGRSEVTLTLVTIDGGALAEARTMLVIAGAALTGVHAGAAPAESRPAALPPSPKPAAEPPPTPKVEPPAVVAPLPPRLAAPVLPVAPPPAAMPPPPPARTAPAPNPEAIERARGYLTRGQGLLDGGDVASARLFFQRAAEAGLWQGALAMGTTFDPAELAARRTVGIRPDPAEARQWYQRARELGAGAAAEQHLRRLPTP